jgi:uncharacterized protein YxjI
MSLDIFGRNRFIVKRELKNFKDTLGILGADMNPLCYAKHQHSWKDMGLGSRMKTTDVRLEGIDGTLLGEITEIPVPQMPIRVMRKWKIYDSQGEFKGAVKEKLKFIGSDWMLESVDGNVIATMKGDRKKHGYEVLTADKQVIARCYAIGENSYGVDILRSDFDYFLILNYIVVLDLAKVWMSILSPNL